MLGVTQQHLLENYGPPHAPGTNTGASAASAPNFCGAEALPTTSASTASAAAVGKSRQRAKQAQELERLEQGLAAGQWMPLSPEADAAPIAQLPPGPGVLVRSGGSSGGSRCCAQPSLHLDRSAAATAHWLTRIGLDPAATLLLNPLPLAHVSGLMPWWRAGCWGAGHQSLAPGLMKTPAELLAFCQGLPNRANASCSDEGPG
mgnify:CR=1 FL=1